MKKSNVNIDKLSTNSNPAQGSNCDEAYPYILLKLRFKINVLFDHNHT